MKEEPQEFAKIANEFTKKKLESLEKYLKMIEDYLINKNAHIIKKFIYELYCNDSKWNSNYVVLLE